tara:strand:+ start:1008 stop:1169 length:162 start_codon:yes stop_codon:yes gene_type:complete
MKKQKNIKDTLNIFAQKIKTAPLYDWYPFEQTKEGLKTRKLIEYAKITQFKTK